MTFQNPDTRREYLLDDDTARLALWLVRRRRESTVRRYLEKSGIGGAEATALVSQLREIGLVCDSRRSPYRIWFERNWRNALYFHLLTRETEYVDRGQPGEKTRKRALLAEYVADRKPPPAFKSYPKPRPLPPPRHAAVPLGQVLLKRRTSRAFSKTPMSLEELSAVLYAAFRPVKSLRNASTRSSRTDVLALTASMFAPYELYFFAGNVAGLRRGLYHYDINRHAVSLLKAGDYRRQVKRAAIGQGVEGAGVVLLISSIPGRYMWRYRHSRAMRNLLIGASSLGQRLILAAQGSGLRNFLTPALRDTEINDLFDMDGMEEFMTYLVALGK